MKIKTSHFLSLPAKSKGVLIMAKLTSPATAFLRYLLLLLFLLPVSYSSKLANSSIPKADVPLLEFPLNLEYFEAEFFLYGALGYGLDRVAPNLSDGGPPPYGGRLANLDPFTKDVITQFGYQEVGHVK